MKKYQSIEERLINNSVLDPETRCWVWIARKGIGKTTYYGKINLYQKGKHVTVRAHRLSYEVFKGITIPYEMQIDHVCGNSLCINPEHLEAVTNAENQRRKYERRA